VGEFYSVALTNNMQQADTGTKMVHVGKNTRSTIISREFQLDAQNSYRGLVKVSPKANGARNYSQCDSMLIGDTAQANTFPYPGAEQHRLEHKLLLPRLGKINCSISRKGHFRRRCNFHDD